MRRLTRRFMRDEKGATVIEYALIVSLLSIVVAAAATALGTQLYNLIGTATTSIH